MSASTTALLRLLLLLLPPLLAVAEARGGAARGGAQPCRALAPESLNLKRMDVPEELLRLASALQAMRPSGGGGDGGDDGPLPPCPSRGGPLLGGILLQERSISPWTYRLNRRADRVPEILPEAACLCAGCVDPHTGRETHSAVSVPVTAHVRVLYSERSSCEPGHARHEERWEEIAVGCTCAAYALAR